MIFEMPAGWVGSGGLPIYEANVLDGDILQWEQVGGKYLVDVSWYPPGHRDGYFVCRLIRYEDWEDPVEERRFNRTSAVYQWLRTATAWADKEKL